MHAAPAAPMLRGMTDQTYDVLVIGAGIAGATAAAHLSIDRRVALIEAEDAAGYHSTGRSAALWLQNYGPPDVRALTGAGRGFFETPPPGFAEHALMSQRRVLFVAPPAQLPHLRQMLAEGIGLREIAVAEARAMAPALREGYAAAVAMEEDSFDIDVAALHQGFLRQTRARGGQLALRSRAGRIERKAGAWHVEVTGGAVMAKTALVITNEELIAASCLRPAWLKLRLEKWAMPLVSVLVDWMPDRTPMPLVRNRVMGRPATG